MKGDHGEDFDKIRLMQERVKGMTNAELSEVWNALYDYDHSEYYDKEISLHEWTLAVYGERREREKNRKKECLSFNINKEDIATIKRLIRLSRVAKLRSKTVAEHMFFLGQIKAWTALLPKTEVVVGNCDEIEKLLYEYKFDLKNHEED
jgi:hypothetical protein